MSSRLLGFPKAGRETYDSTIRLETTPSPLGPSRRQAAYWCGSPTDCRPLLSPNTLSWYDCLLGRHESSAAEIWRANCLEGVLKSAAVIGIIVTNPSVSPFWGNWIPGSPDRLARTQLSSPRHEISQWRHLSLGP